MRRVRKREYILLLVVAAVPFIFIKTKGITIAADTTIAIRRVMRNIQSFPHPPPHLNVTHAFIEDLYTFSLPFSM
jgi:hypothetical protein